MMPLPGLLTRHADAITGVLSCYDRVVLRGTLAGAGHAKGMTVFLKSEGTMIFKFAETMKPVTDALKADVQRLAIENGTPVEYIERPRSFRKEDRIAELLKTRGDAPGLVHVFSVMERCSEFKPWHDKKTGETYLRGGESKCLHYYIYFIDAELGLCFLRVSTHAPFALMFYFNGHNRLAAALRKAGVKYQMHDNAFLQVDDLKKAQELSDKLEVQSLHKKLDEAAARYIGVVVRRFVSYHWSIEQIEYSTDILFRSREALRPVYEALTRTAIHAVKPNDIATFLGRKLTDKNTDEIGNRLNTRIEGTRIRHQMGPASLKMYDKFGQILRIETTTYDVSFFKHHRLVEQQDGQKRLKLAAVRKTIYSMAPDLVFVMMAANQRYLEFISSLDDPSAGMDALRRVSAPVEEGGRRYRGLNFFLEGDQQLLEAVAAGENLISGFRNKNLRGHLEARTPAWTSQALKRLRTHGLIKKIGRTYKYYLTALGRTVVLAGLKVKELVIIPALAGLPA
jgi:hypothetical protein